MAVRARCGCECRCGLQIRHNPCTSRTNPSISHHLSERGQEAATLTGLYLSLYNGTTTQYHSYAGAPLLLTHANQPPSGLGVPGPDSLALVGIARLCGALARRAKKRARHA